MLTDQAHSVLAEHQRQQQAELAVTHHAGDQPLQGIVIHLKSAVIDSSVCASENNSSVALHGFLLGLLVNLGDTTALRKTGTAPERLANIRALLGCPFDHGTATLWATRVGSCCRRALMRALCRGCSGLRLLLYFLDHGRQFRAIDQINVSSLCEGFCLLRKDARGHHETASSAPCGHDAI